MKISIEYTQKEAGEGLEAYYGKNKSMKQKVRQ